VRLHTHLAENQSDVTHSLEKFGMVPGDYAESVGWLGAEWHRVQLSDESILKFGKTGTGVPLSCSNMRLCIAPAKNAESQCTRWFGVDGSASNDAGNLFQEARTALLPPVAVVMPKGS